MIVTETKELLFVEVVSLTFLYVLKTRCEVAITKAIFVLRKVPSCRICLKVQHVDLRPTTTNALHFRHEYVSGYYMVVAYFLSKLVADLIPMRTVAPLVFGSITYWMVGEYRSSYENDDEFY